MGEDPRYELHIPGRGTLADFDGLRICDHAGHASLWCGSLDELCKAAVSLPAVLAECDRLRAARLVPLDVAGLTNQITDAYRHEITELGFIARVAALLSRYGVPAQQLKPLDVEAVIKSMPRRSISEYPWVYVSDVRDAIARYGVPAQPQACPTCADNAERAVADWLGSQLKMLRNFQERSEKAQVVVGGDA